jgi:hypothetical protein
MTWTRLKDMHSGGDTKEDFETCFIEASADEAVTIFYNRFGHNPHRVSCTCCGQDYSLEEGDTFKNLTAWDRGCAWYEPNPDSDYRGQYFELDDDIPEGWTKTRSIWNNEYLTVEEFMKQDDILVIPASEIEDDERTGDVPLEGYVWM